MMNFPLTQKHTESSVDGTYTGVLVESPACSAFPTLLVLWAWTLTAVIWTAVQLNSQHTTQPSRLQQVSVRHPHSHLCHLVQEMQWFVFCFAILNSALLVDASRWERSSDLKMKFARQAEITGLLWLVRIRRPRSKQVEKKWSMQ